MFEGDDIDFNPDAIEAVRRVRQAMDSELQYYTTEASLDDFVKSLHAWMTGGKAPVRILLDNKVEADLIITAISSDQPTDSGGNNHIDFSAWAYFHTGTGPHVRGRFLHAWRVADVPQGSIYSAPLDDVPYGPPER